MPKTIKSKCKSGRKALSNISNRTNPPNQNKTTSKQVEAHNNGGDDVDDDSALDRLHAVHANLSQLIHQIDGLVARAHKFNLANKLGVCDIECFIKVLLATHSTLQGWLPKFEQALGRHSETSDKQTLPLSPIVSSSAINDENLFPLHHFRKSLSPSPLVSWPLGNTSDCGRELFALTPLPKSRTFTDFKGFSTSELTVCGDKGELASVLRTPLPSQHLSKVQEKFKAVTPQKLEDLTPEQVEIVTPQIQKSHMSECTPKIFATPGLEISPPKTCLLMRPISESLQHEKDVSVQSTPPLTVNFRKFDESLSSEDTQIPKSLRIKYPDLFKRVAYDCLPIKTPVQMSPHLGISPPKTCVLMIPSTEVLSGVQGISKSHKTHERDKYSPLPGIPSALSISVDCAESGKSGESIEQKNPDEEGLIAKYPSFLCQALAVPTLSSKMRQTKEGAKKSPELFETSSSRAVYKEKTDLSYVHRSLDNPDSAYPCFSVAESTPASKIASDNVQNTKQRGKQPGEQTLRRELWSKLRAASADVYPNTSKDFLGKLQETSIEENSPTNDASDIYSLAASLSSRKDLIPAQRRIALARSAARVSVMQSTQRSYTGDRLHKAGDVSKVDPMKRPQVGGASKTDSTKMKTPRFQHKAKQAGETSYATRHAPQR